jgi:hypothetical protein
VIKYAKSVNTLHSKIKVCVIAAFAGFRIRTHYEDILCVTGKTNSNILENDE